MTQGFRIQWLAVLVMMVSSIGLAQVPSAVSTTTLNPEPSDRWTDTQLDLRTGVSLRAVEDELNRVRLLGVDARLGGRARFNSWLTGRMGIGFSSTGGSAVSATGEFAPRTNLSFDETYLQISPWNRLALQVGFVDVSPSQSIEIMRSGDHPGLRSEFKMLTLGSWDLKAEVLGVVPTSYINTPRYFPEDGNPTMSGGILSLMRTTDLGVQLGLRYSRIRFNDLTPTIANDSRLAGNRVGGIGTTSARFANEFDIDSLSASVGLEEVGYSLSLEATAAANREVEGDRGFGLHAGGSGKVYLGGNALRLGYSEFRVGSEVYPGSIAGGGGAYNNRQGNVITLGFENRKRTLGLTVSRQVSNEIENLPFIADREAYFFKFTAKTDLFFPGEQGVIR